MISYILCCQSYSELRKSNTNAQGEVGIPLARSVRSRTYGATIGDTSRNDSSNLGSRSGAVGHIVRYP